MKRSDEKVTVNPFSNAVVFWLAAAVPKVIATVKKDILRLVRLACRYRLSRLVVFDGQNGLGVAPDGL